MCSAAQAAKTAPVYPRFVFHSLIVWQGIAAAFHLNHHFINSGNYVVDRLGRLDHARAVSRVRM